MLGTAIQAAVQEVRQFVGLMSHNELDSAISGAMHKLVLDFFVDPC